MSFAELYRTPGPTISLEFFPPKSEAQLPQVLQTIQESFLLQPSFMTVTYGAGGGTRRLTRTLVSFVNNEIPLPAAAHLTCVGHSVDEIDAVLDELAAEGISRIVALRGDPPKGSTEFVPHPQGFSNALELTAHIKKRGGFSVAVAGYPEVHQEAESEVADIDYLKRKVDAGADAVLTQLFFEEDFYFRFRDKAQAAGISVPLVPGVMPISNVAQVKRFTSMCGASIPEELLKRLSRCEQDTEAVVTLGALEAARMSRRLLEEEAPGIHFYTLNKSRQISTILEQLRSFGVLPKITQEIGVEATE